MEVVKNGKKNIVSSTNIYWVPNIFTLGFNSIAIDNSYQLKQWNDTHLYLNYFT